MLACAFLLLQLLFNILYVPFTELPQSQNCGEKSARKIELLRQGLISLFLDGGNMLCGRARYCVFRFIYRH